MNSDSKHEVNYSKTPTPDVRGLADTKPSWLRAWSRKLDVEIEGIERVTEAEREHNTTHVWQACTFWLSVNLTVPEVSIGLLGPLFGLNFWDSFAVIVVINISTALLVAWAATFGLTGLRMLTFCRYSFGYWGNTPLILMSMLSDVGWAAINGISGASCLAALSNGALPSWAGVIILVSCAWIFSVLGIHWIHKFDAFAWIPPLVVWCVAAGTGAKHFHGEAVPSATGPDGAATVLSFIAVICAGNLAWANIAADYNVRMPANAPKHKIFTATYVGLIVPTILSETLGAALYSGAQVNAVWAQSFDDYGVGGPLFEALKPAGGFGKFLMVLAALTAIPTNIPNLYSFALQAQNFGPWAIKIPRIALVTLAFIVATILGCFASLSFASSLETVLNIIGYGITIQITIVVEEHFIFRNASWNSYNWDAWNNPDLLPFGWGGFAGFAMGWVGAALGMQVTGYTAPIAALVGSTGGNIGQELAIGFTAISFPLLRWMEKRWTGK